MRTLLLAALTAVTAAEAASAQCKNAGTSWTNTSIAAQTATFTIGFTAIPTAARSDALVGLSLGTASDYAKLAAVVRFNNAGNIDARNGGAYAATSAMPYLSGAAYWVRAVVDPAAKRYSVWVTPPGAAERQIASNYAFRTEQAGVSSLTNWALTASAGGLQICGFLVQGGGSTGGTPPSGGGSPDSTPPAVSLTAPAAGAALSGAVTLAANASDAVGVAGVQFTADGVPVGAEDTAAPYSTSWNTLGAADGGHQLAAVARDAAGNRATSPAVSVTVNNVSPTPTDCVTAATAWQNGSFSAQSSAFTASFDATPSAAKIDGVVGLSPASASAYSGVAAAVRFNNAGFIDARSGGAYSAASAIPYSAGTKYHFRVVADPATRRYSAYVTPPGSGERPIGTGLAFRTEQASASSLGWRSAYAGTGSVQICGFSVAGGAPPVPAPVPPPAPPPPAPAGADRFGIKKLYPDLPGGKNWQSKWDSGGARTLSSGQYDPADAWFRARGAATYAINGSGELAASGSTVRMYVHEPSLNNGWRNVEITIYGKRVSDSGTAYGGIVCVTRTNHSAYGASETVNGCDSRGSGARIRYDGHADLEKETKHPSSTPTKNKALWGTLPYNAWIGYKLVVYDLPNGNVKLEHYMDTADGANGGSWTKINEIEDTGSNYGAGGTPCRSGINPALRLTASNSRQGSETGRPNVATYCRTDNVGTKGIVYKRWSIREISAP